MGAEYILLTEDIISFSFFSLKPYLKKAGDKREVAVNSEKDLESSFLCPGNLCYLVLEIFYLLGLFLAAQLLTQLKDKQIL